ncbi:hypothetical protein TD95_001925 [Thielaviopsis punctulata]|uniref:Uncharacterized protein n=1 Tax=Thielaviopsis punctulata TaxID=72032 RepID=A0A0F4ZJ33_9PEZI|nr:hypothetical protein TD95_001925 [Thielaviopsis punctulata]
MKAHTTAPTATTSSIAATPTYPINAGPILETANMYAIPPMPHYGSLPHPSRPMLATAPGPFMQPYMPTKPITAPTKPKSTLKALPTVRDHTTDQLCPAGDEYIPREVDEAGDKKILANGELTGTRKYRCHTFRVPNRGDKLFMLATECARILGYRDSYLLFNKNRSLFKIIASQVEKEDLVQQNIIPFSYRSRQIAIVTARSMFRQFGSRVIVDGRRVRDDYWEAKARKQGFTENDLAGDKRPGAGRAREAAAAQAAAAAAAAQAASEQAMMGHPELAYDHSSQFHGPPAHFLPHTMQMPPISGLYDHNIIAPGISDMDSSRREYAGLLKNNAPRPDIAGPAYQDQTRGSSVSELGTQSQHTADYSRTITHQRDMRSNYMHDMWHRPHEQPPSALSQPPPAMEPVPTSVAPVVSASRTSHSPHIGSSAINSSSAPLAAHSPSMMMTAAPYSQSVHAPAPGAVTSVRVTADIVASSFCVFSSGSSSSLPTSQGYSYPPPISGQMWQQPPPPSASQSQTPTTGPQTPQSSYYTTAPPPSAVQQTPSSHTAAQQSPGPRLPPANMQFSPMPSMNQNYAATGQSTIYPSDQTRRQYLPPAGQGSPGSGAQQWWASQ